MTQQHSTTTTPTIAVIGGDGIGPEVTAQAVRVLEAALGKDGFHTVDVELGADHWRATGEVLEDSTLEQLRGTDAILLGAVGAAPGSRDVPSGLLERGLLLKLRFALAHSVNLRPSHWWPGTPTPLSQRVLDRGPVDLVVCREGTEGLYCGNGGVLRQGTDEEIATEVSVNTARGVERVVRDAFSRARNRRRHLTLVHKHNVLVHAGRLWRRVVEEVAQEFDEVEWDYLHVDAATIALVEDPQRFDVIVTDNLFGDILTDLTASITGGIGLAPSANIDPTRANPSMFEPVHGSAPDIAGTGKADPTAAILSAGLLLDHLGHAEAAEKVRRAVSRDVERRAETGPRTTERIGADLAEAVARG